MFALFEGTDAEGTIENIRSNVQLRGANVWILICAAGLASIGLDVNSAAIIIGAMLISPLMSPILGIGLGVGINDRDLLLDSLKNFGVAVAVSILASTLYFMLTPLGQPTPELEARTSPTLLDVGVALFGGIAGIVAGSRREKTNAIPGVAIATALMPPLCTAGFGLATGRWTYFFGAFYLFFINAVFISLSTYLIVRYLHFPYHDFPDEGTRSLTRRWIGAFVIVVAIPSAIIFYGVITDLREQSAVSSFLEDYLTTEEYEPINWERFNSNDSTDLLKVYMVGAPIDSARIDSCSIALIDYGLEYYKLKVIQMAITKEEEERLSEEAARLAMNMMEINQRSADIKQEQIDSLKSQIQRMLSDTIPLWEISKELEAVLPEVEEIGFAKDLQTTQDPGDVIPLFTFDYTGSYGRGRKTMVRDRLEAFLRLRLGLDTLMLRRLIE
ncbi:MAG: TIGR00341 family protein [Chlorobi bacterium]|nr:TIGR00341 family protein [Chlorobiota bacterium]